jgi:hypothetical protein
LVGEYWAEHKKREYPKFKKHKRLFEVLVIVGVAGELLADGGIFGFGSHLQTVSDLDVAKLNKEAGELEKEAASAQLETTRLKLQLAPPELSVENIGAGVDLLRKYDGTTVSTLELENNPQSTEFANILRRYMTVWHWKPLDGGTIAIPGNQPIGITIVYKNKSDSEAALALEKWFESCNLKVSLGWDISWNTFSFVTNSQIVVFIGERQ